MTKLEEKIFKKIKNKKTVKHAVFNTATAISISWSFISPLICILFIDKYFTIKNRDIYMTLFMLSLFCGAYNVYKDISNLYKKNEKD